MDRTLLITIADFFVNLSAGWFGAALIVSPINRPPKRVNLLLLTADLLFATVSLLIAFELRKLAGL